ncbi:MAG: PLP-dependent aminotransferase family protein [Acholeplasmatales bacterium]|nr:PLP-dependent aminotransferase family protein [Acholeplasmatales bacterium]
MRLLSINFRNEEPKYIELYNYIKNAITDGTLSPNEKLPSKRVMASYLSISLNTVMEAYNLLLDEGFIVSIPKKGYYVVGYKLLVDKKEEMNDISIKNDIIYDLSTKNIDSNAFPYYTFNKISKNIIYNENILERSPSFGNIKLRNTIKKYLYETKGININPNNIIIGSGIEYLLTNLIDILDSKSYAIENPGYDKLYKLILNNHKEVELLDVDSEGVDISNIKSDILYITPSNQFPTGIKMSMARKAMIAKWATGNRYIIEDDFDSEFKYLSNKSLSLYDLNKEHTIILQTYSRSLSPSFRLAYMILPDSLINQYKDKYSFYSSTVSTLDQLIVDEFIQSGAYSRNINKNKSLYKNKREILINMLKNYDFLSIDYQSSYLSLIIDVKPFDKKLFKRLAKENGIDISIMDDYYMDDKTDNRIIVGYSGIDINILEAAATKLIDIIKEALI